MKANYPQCLVDELAKYGHNPTYNLDWDRAMLATLKSRNKEDYGAMVQFDNVMRLAEKSWETERNSRLDMSNTSVFNTQMLLWTQIANKALASQRRKYDIDDYNCDVIRFLLYYFHESPLAEDVFPGRGYKIHKNIMLQGKSGAGKTLLMQIFSMYLKCIKSPLAFHSISVTQIVNHFSLYNNIDLYTYHELDSKGFQIDPYHLCLNDIGLENRPFYGIDTNTIINDFLHARNELWSNQCDNEKKFAHLTTNLSTEELTKVFGAKDTYGRTIDRFKTYNVIPLLGDSRR